jgi:hypothetical protein
MTVCFVFVSFQFDDYMINFGYLPKSSIEIGSLTSEETYKTAIESLQVSNMTN